MEGIEWVSPLEIEPEEGKVYLAFLIDEIAGWDFPALVKYASGYWYKAFGPYDTPLQKVTEGDRYIIDNVYALKN